MIALIVSSIADPNDQKFFTELYITHRRLMFSTARKYASKPEDQEDIVQAALEKLLRKISTLRLIECCALSAYIVYTVRSAAIDFLRKERSAKANAISLEDAEQGRFGAENIPITDFEGLFDAKERLNALWSRLSEEDKILLEGKYIWEKPDKELAEILHCKPDSIRMKLTRARRRALDNLLEKEQM